MRDIKFRAWVKDPESWLVKNGDRMIEDFTSKIIFESVGFWSDDELEYMQFTGLLDKNGKEIYEGDIVYAFAESKFPEETIISDIICNTADGMRFEVRCSKDSQRGLSIAWGGWESFEVRGNIYENPELIF